MVHVQSTWFPVIDRNPQTFVDIYKAQQEDFREATQTIHRSAAKPSYIRVNMIPSASRETGSRE
jgi:predicted acyl esterase